MNKIQNYIKEKKVIPTLKFVPDEFQNFTKQVWWLIPFVIWKEDTASWIFVDKNGIHRAHPEDDDGSVIFSWDSVDSFDIEWPEENLCVLTVYSNNSDMYLTFSEFVLEGCGSYLSVIPSIYEIYKPVIEASGEFSWKHGAGGEGYKGFKTQKELLDESVLDHYDAHRLIKTGACDYINIKLGTKMPGMGLFLIWVFFVMRKTIKNKKDAR